MSESSWDEKNAPVSPTRQPTDTRVTLMATTAPYSIWGWFLTRQRLTHTHRLHRLSASRCGVPVWKDPQPGSFQTLHPVPAFARSLGTIVLSHQDLTLTPKGKELGGMGRAVCLSREPLQSGSLVFRPWMIAFESSFQKLPFSQRAVTALISTYDCW